MKRDPSNREERRKIAAVCTKKKKETGHTKKVADITFGGVKKEPPLSFGRSIVPGDKVKGGDEGFLPGEGKER